MADISKITPPGSQTTYNLKDSTAREQAAENKNNISTATAELIELVDNSAKNVINNTLANGSTSSKVTATVDSNLKVTLSGTTPSNTDASFAISSNKSIQSGTYIGNGCPSGGAIDKYRIDYVVNDSTVYRDTGNGVEFTVNDGDVIRSQLVVYRGNTAPSAAFAPMVCLKAAWDVSQKYVPYRPTYEEIVEQVAENENNILSLMTPKKGVITWETGYTPTKDYSAICQYGNIVIGQVYAVFENNLPTTETTIATISGVDKTRWNYRGIGYVSPQLYDLPSDNVVIFISGSTGQLAVTAGTNTSKTLRFNFVYGTGDPS